MSQELKALLGVTPEVERNVKTYLRRSAARSGYTPTLGYVVEVEVTSTVGISRVYHLLQPERLVLEQCITIEHAQAVSGFGRMS